MSELSASDVVRRAMLALSRGDVDAFLSSLHEDIVWHGGGVLLPLGTWRGRAAVRDGLEQSAAARGPLARVVLREVDARGDAVLLLGVVERTGARGTRTTPNSFVCEMRGELIERVTAYASDAVARAAWAGRS